MPSRLAFVRSWVQQTCLGFWRRSLQRRLVLIGVARYLRIILQYPFPHGRTVNLCLPWQQESLHAGCVTIVLPAYRRALWPVFRSVDAPAAAAGQIANLILRTLNHIAATRANHAPSATATSPRPAQMMMIHMMIPTIVSTNRRNPGQANMAQNSRKKPMLISNLTLRRQTPRLPRMPRCSISRP